MCMNTLGHKYLLGLRVGLVGVVQSNLELVDVALQLLLDPQGFSLGALL